VSEPAATGPDGDVSPAPQPRILVGTASWTDKSLIACKRFYPRGCNSAEARLRYYASQYPLVEVDSSYYALPSAANAVLWTERTPAGFVMSVKAFRLFTGHQTDVKVLPQDLQPPPAVLRSGLLYYKDTPQEIRAELWRRFREVLEPLRAAGKLGLVHFQFPPWIVRDGEGRRHVEHCIEQMAGHQLSVEFRHRSWFEGDRAERTLSWLRDLQVVHTIVDEPQGFSNSVPAVWTATSPRTALVRLHGRNAATWNGRGFTSSTQRFNYDYPDAELMEIANQVMVLSRRVSWTHVVFNNNMEDQGVRNARRLMELLLAAGSNAN